MVFPVVMYGCESWTIKKSLVPKNWCFWTVVLETTLESHLACTEIQPVNTEGNQSWKFTGRTDAEAETPIHWPPDEKNWPIWKDRDPGKDWRQEQKGMTDLDSMLKNRNITLLTKNCIVKAMVFPVVMYKCKSWTIKKAECQRTDGFKLWCWRNPWTPWRSTNQS